jgi:hypothetical protein
MSGYFGECAGYTTAYGINGFISSWALPGGTGSIYPSEYGKHSFDPEYSGARGFTLNTAFRNYSIPPVSLSDTFETWRVRTNTDIIGKLNRIKIYGATAGDGMMHSNSTGGTLAFAFSGNVLRTHTTFCNHVSIGQTLRVNGTLVGSADLDEEGSSNNGYTVGYNFDENIIILNNQDNKVGCEFAGLIVGGGVTGPDPDSVFNSPNNGPGADHFVYDRPYMLHKDNMWRTKEGLWLEGKLNHSSIYTGRTLAGSTGEDYPHGAYGYTGCGLTYSTSAEGGVSRVFFGPTLSSNIYLDFDGRNGVYGGTGDAWYTPFGTRATGGKEGALVISNSDGPLVEFDTNYATSDYGVGFTNILRGANKKRINKTNHNFKVGNVLRYRNEGTDVGFTFASAMGYSELHGDSINASEVVGMVSNVPNKDTFDLTFLGEVSTTDANWKKVIINNESLSPGCVYYCSVFGGSERGKIQKNRPGVVGLVLKPVMIATGLTTGVFLPMTGHVLGQTGSGEGTGGAGAMTSQFYGGASGNDATIFSKGFNTGSESFSVGQVVAADSRSPSGLKVADYRSQGSLSQPLGVVVQVNTTTGLVDVMTGGYYSLTENIVPASGTYYLGENGGLASVPPARAIKILDAIAPNTFVVNIQNTTLGTDSESGAGTYSVRGSNASTTGQTLNVLSPTGSTGFTFDNVTRINENQLINGSFDFWQRGVGVTGPNGYTGNSHSFFADRWIRVSQTGTGGFFGNNPYTGKSSGTHRVLDYKLKREKFDKKQVEVEGHPNYYASVKGNITFAGGTNNNEYYKIEQRIPDVTSFAGQVMTASFYAKGSVTGDMHLAWLQNYAGGSTGPTPGATTGGSIFGPSAGVGPTASQKLTPITDFRLGTDWSRYAYSFFVPEVSNAAGASGEAFTNLTVGPTADHYAALSFFTQLTSLPDGTPMNVHYNGELSLAQVKLEQGNVSTFIETKDLDNEFRKCQRFYQHSYELGDHYGQSTMRNDRQPDIRGVTFVVTGNFMHIVKFPVEMRAVPSVGISSPTGVIDEGFNRDAGSDMRFVAGTKNSLGELRTTQANSQNVSVFTDRASGLEIRVLRGAAKLDSVTVHYFAEAEINKDLPDGPVER